MGEHRPHSDREDVFPHNRYKKSDRFQIIAKCIRSEDRRARKPRLQILAARLDQEIDIDLITGLIAAGWTKGNIDWIRHEQRMVATMVCSSIVRTF